MLVQGVPFAMPLLDNWVGHYLLDSYILFSYCDTEMWTFWPDSDLILEKPTILSRDYHTSSMGCHWAWLDLTGLPADHDSIMSWDYSCNYLYYQLMFVPSCELCIGWYIYHKTNIQLQRTHDNKSECTKLARSCHSVLTHSTHQIDIPFRCTTYPRRSHNWFTPLIMTHTGRY